MEHDAVALTEAERSAFAGIVDVSERAAAERTRSRWLHGAAALALLAGVLLLAGLPVPALVSWFTCMGCCLGAAFVQSCDGTSRTPNLFPPFFD